MLSKNQKVRVRKDLKVGNYYGGFRFDKGMKSFLGMETEILGTPTVRDDCYYIKDDESRHEWPEAMLEVIDIKEME